MSPTAARVARRRGPTTGRRGTPGQPRRRVDDVDALFREGHIPPSAYDAHVRRALAERRAGRAEGDDPASLSRQLAHVEWEKASLSALLLPHDLDRVLDVVLYYAPLFQPAEAVAVHLVGGTPPDLELVAHSGGAARGTRAPAGATHFRRVHDERRADVFRASPSEATPYDRELGIGDAVTFPLPAAGAPLGVLSWINKPAGRFEPADAHDPTLRQFVAHAAFAIERARTTTRLRHLADYDQMTGLVRRDRFPAFARRAATELGGAYVHLAVLDFDRFKRVNDRHGHLAGDEVITRAAEAIRERAGPNVVASHWGGDEFALALVADSAREGEEFVEGLRRAVGEATAAWSRERGDHPITVSAGGATARRAALDLRRLLRRADANLLLAKERGRDRTLWGAAEDAT